MLSVQDDPFQHEITGKRPIYRLQSVALASPPADSYDLEPISLVDMKMYLKVKTATEETLIKGLAIVARTWVEQYTGQGIARKGYKLWMDNEPGAEIEMPYPPLILCSKISYFTSATVAVETTVSASNYTVDTTCNPGRIYLNDTYSWTNGDMRTRNNFCIAFECGQASPTTNTPSGILEAIRQLTCYLYEHRGESVDVKNVAEAVPIVKTLLFPYRQLRLA